VAAVVEEPEIAPSITALRAEWSRWDREMLVLVLRPVNDTAWAARIVDQRGTQRGVTYSRTTGWCWD
jgi:hypothetical protein